ncbi:hypothetical protein PS726_00554 [Pseudomonas fluorescens]|nr:hypothetical protein PS726_00554 [Pseudomonas fluorescens]
MSGGEEGRQVAVWRYRHSCAARSKLDGLKVEVSNWRSYKVHIASILCPMGFQHSVYGNFARNDNPVAACAP